MQTDPAADTAEFNSALGRPPPVPSSLADLGGVPLAGLGALNGSLLRQVIQRVTDPEESPVPVAAFQSAI